MRFTWLSFTSQRATSHEACGSFKSPCGSRGADSSPSIEVIVKLAQAFDVSVDYLLGVGLHARYSKDVLERVDDIENLPAEERQRIFNYIDLVTRDYKAKKVYKK